MWAAYRLAQWISQEQKKSRQNGYKAFARRANGVNVDINDWSSYSHGYSPNQKDELIYQNASELQEMKKGRSPKNDGNLPDVPPWRIERQS